MVEQVQRQGIDGGGALAEHRHGVVEVEVLSCSDGSTVGGCDDGLKRKEDDRLPIPPNGGSIHTSEEDSWQCGQECLREVHVWR